MHHSICEGSRLALKMGVPERVRVEIRLRQSHLRRGTVRCEMISVKVQIRIARAVLIAAGFPLGAAPALAERPARAECTALYSFLSSEAPDGDNSFHGLRSDLTVYLNRYFGIGATLVNSQPHNTDLMFGPEFAVLDKGPAGVRLHTRAGAVERLAVLNVERAVQSHVWNFATAAGLSLDVNIKGLNWRLQPEIVWWRRLGTHTDFRLSTGIVARWGTTR